MRYSHIKLQDFLQSYNPLSPTQQMFKSFKQNLKFHIAKIADSKKEGEEHQKNILTDFLDKTFSYDCNTKDKIDLVIYEDSTPRVLFETKRSSNKSEFIKKPKKATSEAISLESKALYEAILYYLREFITNKNNNIAFIILTNTQEFYCIDAKDFVQFAKDKRILKAFNNCEKKEGNDTSTEKFYNELESILPTLESELKFTYFCLDKFCLNDDSTLALLYQILSPQVLLKHKTYLDSNTLNQNFYDELLYILGLEEKSQNSKVLIEPSKVSNTLLDSLCSALNLQRDKDFETIFTLLTTWNNRLLFLRLLESMLLSFKHITKPFLDLEILKDFSALNALFFDVLAQVEENRDKNLLESLQAVPYLNSSLFERTILEKQDKEIKELKSKPLKLYADSILYKDKAICKALNLKDRDSTLPLLEYLFAFLHAYDFTTTAQDIQNYTKINFDKLINSAVLGLVFEKLNGYKEGSFYTPSFITSYMCKESLQKVVIEKFNSAKSWGCKDLESLKTRLDKLTNSKNGYKETNKIFDSIRICDPAVGSGHFLVSALNELILLKFQLGILCDEHYERIKDITLEILRDEIVIRDSNNALFTYTLPAHDNIESHKIQRALFHNKRTLIESCLFGVDINPNSCEITKLRLWIEILKYSYYKDIENKRLETLPNIDINIKCGNSLISNIALDTTKDSLIKQLKAMANKNASLEFSAELKTTANDLQNKLPAKIEKYKNAVNAYKKETNIDLKTLHKQTIIDCQDFIIEFFKKMSNEYQEFKKSLADYLKNSGWYGIDEGKINREPLDSTIKQRLNTYAIDFNFHKTLEIPQKSVGFVESELVSLIDCLHKYENLKNNQNRFEWRFAFPEVLDSNGDFLGFDLVIGNPPYGVELTKPQREQYKDIYKTSNTDTASLFILKSDSLLTKNGINCLIVPKTLTFASNWKQIRDFVQPTFFLLTDCGKAWSYVLLEMIIFARQKGVQCATYHTGFLQDTTYTKSTQTTQDSITEIDKRLIDLFDFFPNNLSKEELEIGIKIRLNSEMLEKYSKNYRGITYQKHLKNKGKFAFIGGKEINKYGIKNYKGFIDDISQLTNNALLKDNSLLIQNIVAHIQNPTPHIKITAMLPINKKIFLLDTINQIVFKQLKLQLMWAILNSTLMNWYVYRFIFAKAIRTMHFDSPATNKIPIPKITKANQKIANKIIALVEKILKSKAKDSTFDTNELESQIDKLVYSLYDLNNEEIRIIES